MPAVADAATVAFTVNATGDGHDATRGNGVCATSGGRCTLRAAIEESNAQPAGTTVTVSVPAGTFKLAEGTLAVTHNTITGAGEASTIVQGNGTVAVVSVSAGAHAALARLRLSGGGPGKLGGGPYNAGSATLTGALVIANSASSGGGITNTTGATLQLVSTTVASNQAASGADSVSGGPAGGILNGGTLTLTSSKVSGNDAGSGGIGVSDNGGNGGNGGGIVNTGTLTAASSTISGNFAGSGGAGEQQVPGSGGSGGGIYSSAGSVTLTNSTVSGNTAGSAGADLTGTASGQRATATGSGAPAS